MLSNMCGTGRRRYIYSTSDDIQKFSSGIQQNVFEGSENDLTWGGAVGPDGDPLGDKGTRAPGLLAQDTAPLLH